MAKGGVSDSDRILVSVTRISMSPVGMFLLTAPLLAVTVPVAATTNSARMEAAFSMFAAPQSASS